MTNQGWPGEGDDPTGGGGAATPPGAPPGGGPGGSPGGSDTVEVGLLVDHVLLLGRRGTPLLIALGMVAAALALLHLPGWILTLAATSGAGGGFVSAVGGCFGLLSLLTVPIMATVATGLARPARRILLEGVPAPEPLAALEEATRGFGASALAGTLFAVALGVGALLCVLPGFAAFVMLVFVPYLVATQSMELGAALTRSIELAQRHVVTLVVVVAPIAIVVFGALVAVWVLGLLASQLLGAGLGTAVAGPISYVVGQVVLVAAWLWTVAALVTIESVESGTPVVR